MPEMNLWHEFIFFLNATCLKIVCSFSLNSWIFTKGGVAIGKNKFTFVQYWSEIQNETLSAKMELGLSLKAVLVMRLKWQKEKKKAFSGTQFGKTINSELSLSLSTFFVVRDTHPFRIILRPAKVGERWKRPIIICQCL